MFKAFKSKISLLEPLGFGTKKVLERKRGLGEGQMTFSSRYLVRIKFTVSEQGLRVKEDNGLRAGAVQQTQTPLNDVILLFGAVFKLLAKNRSLPPKGKSELTVSSL